MTKNKTRAALVSSVISLILCFSMLLGTTFAWFTDEAATGVNMIQAGTLEIDIVNANGESLEGQPLEFQKAAGAPANEEVLWEPGCTYKTQQFKLENKGNLHLKYKVVINGVTDGSDAKLLEAIDFTLGDLAMEGELAPGASTDLTYLQGHMKEEAGNEYQGLTLEGLGITVYATQLAAEYDSFDNQYDANSNYTGLAAKVTDLGEMDITATAGIGGEASAMTLDAAFQFEPTQSYEQAQASEYRYWHADFVVSANKDVPANSVALAGYYSEYCDDYNGKNWVALTSPEAIEAGQEIRLVQSMGGGSISVNYEELCNYGNDGIGFRCGVADLTDENVGTTITVELRLYETTADPTTTSGSKNIETGNYVVMGTYTYTFVEKPTKVTSSTELADVVAAGETYIALADGEYNIADCGGKDLTIVGSRNAVIKLYNEGEDGCDYGFGSAGNAGGNYTLNGVTIDTSANTGNYKGYCYFNSMTYNDCAFKGAFSINAYYTATFNNCEFDFNDGYFWTWGAKEVNFNECVFGGNSKTILAHGKVNTNINIKDCTFAATEKGYTGSGDNTAVVEIDPVDNNTYTITFSGNNTKTDSYAGWTRIKDDSTGHTITGV